MTSTRPPPVPATVSSGKAKPLNLPRVFLSICSGWSRSPPVDDFYLFRTNPAVSCGLSSDVLLGSGWVLPCQPLFTDDRSSSLSQNLRPKTPRCFSLSGLGWSHLWLWVLVVQGEAEARPGRWIWKKKPVRVKRRVPTHTYPWLQCYPPATQCMPLPPSAPPVLFCLEPPRTSGTTFRSVRPTELKVNSHSSSIPSNCRFQVVVPTVVHWPSFYSSSPRVVLALAGWETPDRYHPRFTRI